MQLTTHEGTSKTDSIAVLLISFAVAVGIMTFIVGHKDQDVRTAILLCMTNLVTALTSIAATLLVGKASTTQKVEAPGSGPITQSDTTTTTAGSTGAALLIVCCVLLPFALGCHKQVSAGPPPALPAGAADSIDANAYRVLRPAHDFAESISSDALAQRIHLTRTEARILNDLNRAINAGDSAAVAYHSCAISSPAGQCQHSAVDAAVAGVLRAWTSLSVALVPATK